MRENALVFLSTSHGPWVGVRKTRAIRAHGLGPEDRFRIVTQHKTLVEVSESGEHKIEETTGHIKLERISGDTPITVFAIGD